MVNWFGDGHTIDLLNDTSEKDYKKTLDSVPGLKELVRKYQPKLSGDETYLFMEFCLFGLAEYSFLSKLSLEHGLQFKDLLSSMFTISDEDEPEPDSESVAWSMTEKMAPAN